MSEQKNSWYLVCAIEDIDEEDVMQFDLHDQTYAVYHTDEGFFATDGMCTHEKQHLADGFVIDGVIECPLHQGRFDIATGKALGAPVCIDLKTYELKLSDGNIFIRIE